MSNQIPENLYFSKDDNQFNLQITKAYTDIALAINARESGVYDTIETSVGKKFYSASPQTFTDVFRKVVPCGILPNAATTVTPHGIVAINIRWIFIDVYGQALDPVAINWISIPNGGNFDMSLRWDNTNIYIQSAINLSAYTQSWIILEYAKLA